MASRRCRSWSSFRRGVERAEERTLIERAASPTRVYVMRQRVPHPVEVADLLADPLERGGGPRLNQRAGGLGLFAEPEQIADLGEREPELLRPLDEPDAPHRV